MTVTVFERLQATQPRVLEALVLLGLLSPGLEPENRWPEADGTGRPQALAEGDIEELMRHDSYRRVRGALRQMGWGS